MVVLYALQNGTAGPTQVPKGDIMFTDGNTCIPKVLPNKYDRSALSMYRQVNKIYVIHDILYSISQQLLSVSVK